MKIIDWEAKGNLVRFFLGDDALERWHGDDWNDAPYEHNAGEVYDRFIAGHRDVVFPFNMIVIEPDCGYFNSPWCKDDIRDRKIPCLVVVPEMWDPPDYPATIMTAQKCPDAQSFYFGDKMESGDATTS